MNIFKAVKENISTRQAAEHYGIEIGHNGMACCPFHNDHTPSMKTDKRFHCFGCGADGDVIDFTARLFNLNKKEAAEKLAKDFGIAYNGRASPRKAVPQKSDAQKYYEAEQYCFRVLNDYFHLLKKWETEFAPASPDEEWHPQFVEALKMKTDIEYLLDIFTYGSTEKIAEWIAGHGKEVMKLEQRISELTAGAESGGYGDS